MKLVRYIEKMRHQEVWGVLDGQSVYKLLGDPLGDWQQGEEIGPLDHQQLLAPCRPRKVIAAAINYYGATDWEESQTEPVFFLKSPTSVCSAYSTIVSAFDDVPTWGEAELAIVIGKTIKEAQSFEEAESSIFGYTVANDASCENLGQRDHHLARSKAADTFCPLGPYIDTEYDWHNKKIEGWHNNTLVRAGNTDSLFWDPIRIVKELSQWMTLEPWDIILTGSPPLTCPLSYFEDGDWFVGKVEGFPDIRSSFQQSRPISAGAREKFSMQKASDSGSQRIY
ncbi:MAG TPA: fumarylacetoacetate hydrolase family protein [Oligoflexus sp.]|uniref:fumarylacetoacetate hydrolase family protein n=1 Tax=Oligoflexus sp. TaxID=1971216 RepID=UPI002D7299CA|nr:fumarylacetoacetate hydrolase family protein [Oligoflexus sp.]HYX35068.1 fumarylacetoacetate hydrolase family protein [Oligoflexus sp.]